MSFFKKDEPRENSGPTVQQIIKSAGAGVDLQATAPRPMGDSITRNNGDLDLSYAPQGAKPAARQQQPEAPKRPGSTPPKAYIDSATATINKTLDNYYAELALLDKDIDKLTEERRQLKVAIAGLDAALLTINTGTDSKAGEPATRAPLGGKTPADLDREAFEALERELASDGDK